MLTEAVRMTTASVVSINKMCPKCGNTKKSGKLSCCARDGAWFKNCGDAGDSNFDHTWIEGIQACKSMSVSAEFYNMNCTLYCLFCHRREFLRTIPLTSFCPLCIHSNNCHHKYEWFCCPVSHGDHSCFNFSHETNHQCRYTCLVA